MIDSVPVESRIRTWLNEDGFDDPEDSACLQIRILLEVCSAKFAGQVSRH